MLLLIFLRFIFPLTASEKQALHKEDLRMARHLISEGMTVTHPDYPFLKSEKPKVTGKHNKAELKREDSRMMRHLALEGYTVN